MEPVFQIFWWENVRHGFVRPNTVENERAVAAKFLRIKNQADVGMIGAQTGEEIPIHAVPRKRKRERDLILPGQLADDPTGFDDFGGLLFLRERIQLGVAARVRAEDEAFRLHFADLRVGEKGLVGAKVGWDVQFEGLAELVNEGFGGLLVGEEPGGESNE